MEQFFLEFAEAISPALQVLLQALAAALVAQLVQFVRAKYNETKASLSNEQQAILEYSVSAAIRAAEQVLSDGAQKKAYALLAAEKRLKAYGIILDLDIIADEIEAQVFTRKRLEG